MEHSTNPFESPRALERAKAKTPSEVPLLVALLMAILAPMPITAICFLLIAMSAECNTYQCRKAHTIIGAICGILPIPPLSLIAGLSSKKVRLPATIAGLVLWTLASSFTYYMIMT